MKTSKWPESTSTAPIGRRRGTGAAGQFPQLLELEVLIQDVAEQVRSPGRQMVRADLGQDHVVPQAHHVQHRLVDDPVPGLGRGDGVPEVLQLLAGQKRVAPQQPVPGQGRAMAPPEVPLSATTSTSSGSRPSNSWRTPAENTVWLPPPWQAIATRLRGEAPMAPSSFQFCRYVQKSATRSLYGRAVAEPSTCRSEPGPGAGSYFGSRFCLSSSSLTSL